MRNILIISLVFTIALCGGLLGCTPEKPPEEEKPEPIPLTVDQIVRSLNKAIAPLISMGDNAALGVSKVQVETAKKSALDEYRRTKTKHNQEENATEALSKMPSKVSDLVRKARDTKRWYLVKAGVDLYLAMKPGDTKYKRLVERADIMLARPVVKVTGFMDVDNELYAFLEVFDPKTKEKETYKIREGEDFHEVVQLIRIIGDKQSVELLYKPINDPWIVEGPNQ